MEDSTMDRSALHGSILSPLDICIFGCSIVLSILIGLYFANKNKTMEDYMLGGRDQKLLPVSVSMMTSFVSGLTLIGNAADFYYHGFTYMTVAIPHFLSTPVTSLILLPVFHRMGSVSVYIYLEKRFHRLVKWLVSLSFMLQMTLYNAVVLSVPAISLQTILGISPTVSIGVVGASCLIYSTFGGLKAIIWTDFFQAGLMYLSVACIAIGGIIEAGGFMKLLDINREAGRFNTDSYFNFDLNTRHTFFTVVAGMTINGIFINGASQIQVQRALSLPTLRMAQWSLLMNAIFVTLISASCSLLGFVLTASYADCDPILSGQIEKPDSILIYYLKTHLMNIPGLRGLFVAGVFAATLSTLSSFQNSMSALLLEDFIKPCLIYHDKQLSSKVETWLSKVIALLFGLTCIGLSIVVGKVSGLMQIALTLYGALGGPILSAFLLGMLTRFTNTFGVMCGMISGFIFGAFIETYQTFYLPAIKPTMPLSITGCPSNTTSAHLFLSPSDSLIEEPISNGLEKLLTMSYLWLPVFVVLITCSVSIVVSILTGGLDQDVDENHLISWLGRNKVTNERCVDSLIVANKCQVLKNP